MAAIEKATFVGIAGVEGMDPVSLGPGSYVLGRSDGNDIVIKKNDISRQHARIEVAASGVTVTDLGSANGTKLNGQRIAAPAKLAEGDEIQFGDRRFRVELTVKQETAPMPLASDSGQLEATAIWKPPAQIAAIADRPAEATAAWIPAPAAPAPLAAKPASPPAKPAPPPPRPKAAPAPEPAAAKPAKRRSLVPVLLLLILVAGAGLGAILLLPQLTGGGGGTTLSPGPLGTVVAVPEEAPPKVREAELAKLSRPDRLLYTRAAYFYQIRNYVGARDIIRPLVAKYPGNQALKRKHDQVEASIKNELHRQMQYAVESTRFLKHSEALEAYRAVLRLAEPGTKERAEAEKQVRILEAQIKAPQLE